MKSNWKIAAICLLVSCSGIAGAHPHSDENQGDNAYECNGSSVEGAYFIQDKGSRAKSAKPGYPLAISAIVPGHGKHIDVFRVIGIALENKLASPLTNFVANGHCYTASDGKEYYLVYGEVEPSKNPLFIVFWRHPDSGDEKVEKIFCDSKYKDSNKQKEKLACNEILSFPRNQNIAFLTYEGECGETKTDLQCAIDLFEERPTKVPSSQKAFDLGNGHSHGSN